MLGAVQETEGPGSHGPFREAWIIGCLLQSPKGETHEESKNKPEGSQVREIIGLLTDSGWFYEKGGS